MSEVVPNYVRDTKKVWLPKTVATWCLLVLGATQVAADDGSGTVVPVHGERFHGQLVSIDNHWRVNLAVGGATRHLPLNDLLHWGSYRDAGNSPQVLLTDGSVLPGKVLLLNADSLVIETSVWGEVRVDTSRVHGVLLLPSRLPLQRDRQWKRLKNESASGAKLFLRNGDEIAGKLAAANADTDDVAVFGITSVNFAPQGGAAQPFAVRNLEMLAIRSTDRSSVAGQCTLGFRDGALLALNRLLGDENTLELELACGVKLSVAVDRTWKHVTLVESKQNDVTFLSDLTPTNYRSFPFLSVEWPLGIDENVFGGRLRSGGCLYSKGLGMHATSRVVYNLEGKYTRLEADLALDDQAGNRGSVVYRVFVERLAGASRKWSPAYTSPIVRGSDKPRSISVDVADATRIALAVETADGGDTLDHANWLRIRLTSDN